MEYLKKDINVLYVDDEIENLNAFKASFRKNYTVHIANSAKKGRDILNNNKIQIVITDQRMPETTGVEFLCSVKNDYPNAIRMLITAYTDINTVIEAVNECQVYKYLTKPWDIKELRSVIDRAYEVYVLREENKQLISDLLNINDKLDLLLKQNDINMLLQSKPDKLSQFKRGFDDIVDFITKKK